MDQKLYVRQIGVNGIMVGYCVLLKLQFACKSRLWNVANSTSSCTKTHHFGMKIFLERGHSPLHRPLPRWGGGHPLPTPYPLGACGASLLGASILAPSALGVPTLIFFYKLTTACWVTLWIVLCINNIWRYQDTGRAGASPAQSPCPYTKCNSPPIIGQCTNFILFDVAL